MKKITSLLLLLTFLMSACSRSSRPTESTDTRKPVTLAAATADSVATEIYPTETAVAVRKALLSKIENSVSARKSSTENLIPALEGMAINSGGGVETGSDGRARIDLLPEGTIIRVGPNSSFSLPQLVEVNGQPKTTIELFFGKIYILLSGGSLEVITPTGIASVRGSVMSVHYDPDLKRLEASCLEGHCSLEDEEGTEVELTEGEESHIDFDEAPVDPEAIDSAEIQDWLDEIPEMEEFFEVLPDPEDYPEPDPDDLFPTEEAVTEEPSTEEPATEEPATEEPAAEEPPTEEPSGWFNLLTNFRV